MRSVCYDCEQLHFNWERVMWPRLSVLERHVSTELCDILRLHRYYKAVPQAHRLHNGHEHGHALDQLPIRLSTTEIAPRQLIPILGLDGAKDVQELRRLKFFPMIKQRVRGLVSLGVRESPKQLCLPARKDIRRHRTPSWALLVHRCL